MALLQHRDGELRLYTANNWYLEVLFVDAGFSYPIARPKPEEVLCTDSGEVNKYTTYCEGSDDVAMAPLPFAMTCSLADSATTRYLVDWVTGVTQINSVDLDSTKGTTTVDIAGAAVTTPVFADPSKQAYNVEILYDVSGTTQAWRLSEVYFPPEQQTVTEGDVVSLSVVGSVYGKIEKITAFTTGRSLHEWVSSSSSYSSSSSESSSSESSSSSSESSSSSSSESSSSESSSSSSESSSSSSESSSSSSSESSSSSSSESSSSSSSESSSSSSVT